MSLCDVCMSPTRHCCKRMHITGGVEGRRLSDPMSFERAEHLAMEYKLPFPSSRADRELVPGHFGAPKATSHRSRCGDPMKIDRTC
jgi:hypothetical protein